MRTKKTAPIHRRGKDRARSMADACDIRERRTKTSGVFGPRQPRISQELIRATVVRSSVRRDAMPGHRISTISRDVLRAAHVLLNARANPGRDGPLRCLARWIDLGARLILPSHGLPWLGDVKR